MAKAKTSKKRKSSSVEDLPIVRLRHPESAKDHSPTEHLKSAAFTIRALTDALQSGDMKAFKEIVRNHYEAVNTADILRKAHLSKRTFYEAISQRGNPTLSTVTKIIQGIAS